MLITELSISNFKTLKNFNIKFQRGYNLIIGKNNTGKSNILMALDRIVNDKIEFKKSDISKIENTGILRPNFTLKINTTTYVKENDGYTVNGHSRELSYLVNQFSRESLIYINIQKDYHRIIKLVIDQYNELDEQKQEIFNTQINIDFNDVLGIGNTIYVQNESVLIIDEYADNSKIENKSSGVQRVALIVLLLTLFKVSKRTNRYILMLDEPETNLHIDSQRKLHRLLLEFSKANQVIVSTHSTIFMQDISSESINYIDRDSRRGSFTDNDDLGFKNFKRIRETLGLQVSDTLFLSENIVAVEGITDVRIHEYVYNRLYPNKERYTFFTIEGADKATQNIIALKQVLGKDVTIILDNDTKGNSIKGQIEKHEFIEKSKVIVQPTDGDGELEDLFPKDFLKSTIKEYIKKQDSIIRKSLGNDYEDTISKYEEILEGFDSFSQVETIGDKKGGYQVKSEPFARYLTSELRKLEDDRFNEVVTKFKDLYAQI